MQLEKLTVTITATIKDTIAAIDKNAVGLCFVVDEAQQLQGVVTDGDIRRGIMQGQDLAADITTVMTRQPVHLPVEATNEEILKTLSSKIKAIPLVDASGKLVDYAAWNRIRRIPVAEPSLAGNELEYVVDCIKSTWISSKGKYIDQFQTQFQDYCQMPHALAVSNGTVALHLALEALEIGAGDEVIVPNLTFAASINAILYTGATPVIADIDPITLNIDVEAIEALITPATKAIMVVHLYGYPCEMDEVVALAQKHNLLLVEDCAEALGTTYKGRPVGSFGDAATFSFFGNKTITTGEGGMVLFRDDAVADRAGVLKDHGMNKSRRYWHDIVGFNYRMTNMQAALGVAQMENVDAFVSKKRAIAATYNAVLAGEAAINLPLDSETHRNSFWLYSITFNIDIDTEQLIKALLAEGVETRPIFYPLHVMPVYAPYARQGDYPGTEQILYKGISLPSAVTLSLEEAKFVGQKLLEVLKRHTA